MKKLLILPLLIFAACTKVDLEQQVEPPVDSTHVACSLSLVKDEIVFDEPYKDSKNAYFYASCDWTVEPTGGESWITIDPASGSGSDKKQKIKITVSENTSGDDRFCEVAFKMDDEIQLLTVRQPKGEIEEEGDDETPPTPPAPQKNYPWTKRVASMHADYYFDEGGTWDYEFMYDKQGRVVKYTVLNRNDYEEWTSTYLYVHSDSQVKLYYDEGADEAYSVNYKFNNGCLSLSQCDGYGYSEYVHDDNGHLVSCTDYSLNGVVERLWAYVWNGDNLISTLRDDKIYENYEYYDIVNKCNVEIYLSDWARMPEYEYMIDRSIFGSCVGKNLLKKGSEGTEYTYDFDSDGYVTKVYCSDEDGKLYDLTITYEEPKAKKVSSVSGVGIMSESGYSDSIEYTFKYDDQNRVSKVTEKGYSGGELWGDNVYAYTYTDNSLVVTGTMYEEHYGVFENYSTSYSYAFENGFCINYEHTQTWNNTYREEYAYSYMSSLLSGMYGSWWHSGTEYPESNSYGWAAGNLVDFGGDSIEYYDVRDKSNLEVWRIVRSLYWGGIHEIITADKHLFKGFHSTDLVKTMSDGECVLTYEFDKDGYVVKALCMLEEDEDYDHLELTIVYE